jgi:hypothetical protein
MTNHFGTLIEFDLTTKTKNTLDIAKIITSETIEEIKNKFGLAGINIEITGIQDFELVTRKYYECNGYIVERGSNFISKNETPYYKNEYKKLQKLFGIDENLIIQEYGCPDWFVYKEKLEISIEDANLKYIFSGQKPKTQITEAFFVEVKSANDGLRLNQLEWVFNYSNIPVKVMYLE